MRNKALIYVIFLVLISWLQMEQQQNATASDTGVQAIPEEAIRLRILAHDNSPEEQLVKTEVRDAVNIEIRSLVEELNEKDKARETIKQSLPELEKIVQDVLETNDMDARTFSIDLKSQVEFPTRIYGPLVYPAGTYEALVISIGEGEGENWWCVLFPPLCFIPAEENEETVENEANSVDKSTENKGEMEQEEENVEESREYTFFIVEKWNKWFGSNE
ncbi:stage II sporulation protein R [Salibacterium salarium]|uniref:Stage II sporulation protein R n=1 Tax=Salibacterium salarium TaxID=284579 RepID=A0A3R9P1L2_9BACI|nr:stage II sporulation protein R [Salibacterium salarium]RSL28931.1 stage II sporulation protein R [Salibacterium salarium]